MTDPLQMSLFQILEDTGNATSSQESAGGHTPCASPDGQTKSPSGPEVLPASHSARQDSEKDTTTSDTSPLSGSVLSNSAGLQRSLANRLQARLGEIGSLIYGLKWKDWDTQSGPPICALRARAHPTSVSVSFLALCSALGPAWPLPQVGQLSGWPTAHTSASTGAGTQGRAGGLNIQTAAAMAGWPTATTRDHKDGASEGTAPINGLLGRTVWLAGWPTANAGPQNDTDTKWRERREECKKKHGNNGFGLTLGMAVQEVGPMRLTSSGETRTGSFAEMPSGGQLNPAHSRWIMGYPPEWDACAVTAMPSSRKSRKFS
ncbi:hypothetical protein PVV74_11580 [Roseovarius sp. SK2]|nr:hypothetical protein [Roseovarius sp. SK2]MDD9726097.1 hypothetical protein [Roseovarius sp. SK2]